MKHILTTIFITTFSYYTFAQSEVALKTVSVTSSRVKQNPNETGRSITIIKGSELSNLPVFSIDELLKYVPGVEVQSRGPMGAQSDIVIRGGTFQQVLILVDGIKINDPITGHFNANIPLAPYEIEQIEILRGPAAAAYGSAAVGGVINIITKTFQQFDTTKNQMAKVKLGIGEYNLLSTDAGFRFTGKKWNVLVAALSNNTSGQLIRMNNRAYIYNQTFSTSASTMLKNNWRLSLRAAVDQNDFAAQNYYTSFVSDNATEKVGSVWGQAQAIQIQKKGFQQFDIATKYTNDFYKYNSTTTPNKNKSLNTTAQYIKVYPISSKINSTFGAQFSQRSIISNDRGNHTTAQGALFGSVLYSINKWHYSGSLRVENDQNYGFSVLPQFAASYILPKVTFRINIGKAIRGADFTERYNNYNKDSVKSGSIGDPNLTTEKSWSYEVGANVKMSKHVIVNTSLFLRKQNNLIDWINTPYSNMPRQENLMIGGNYALAKNIKDLTTKGLEIDATYIKSWNQASKLTANIGLTVLNSTSSDTSPSYYILAHAKLLVQSTIMYQYKKITASVDLLYKERQATNANAIQSHITPSYFLTNVYTAYSLDHKVKLFIQCNNIGNVQYADLLGSKMPNRWWSIGAQILFDRNNNNNATKL